LESFLSLKIVLASMDVLFVGNTNVFRSIVAEALFNEISTKFKAKSAGMKKAERVDPGAAALLEKRGLSVSKKPELYTFDELKAAKKVISFGCEGGICLPLPSTEWKIENPEGKSASEKEKIFLLIEEKVKELVNELEGAG
jgi:protein-tyrosine-phosphatase